MKRRAKVEAKLVTRRIYVLKVSEEEKIMYITFFLLGVFIKKKNALSKYYDKLDTKVRKVEEKGFSISVSDIASATNEAMVEAGKELFFYMYID